MPAQEFTPTERRMLAVLSDGMMHSREELHACLPDDLDPLSAIRNHVSNLRKKLLPKGQDIVCQLHLAKTHYRHVRLLVNPYDGRK